MTTYATDPGLRDEPTLQHDTGGAEPGDLIDGRYELLGQSEPVLDTPGVTQHWRAHDTRLARAVVVQLTYWPAGAPSPLSTLLAQALQDVTRVYDAGDHRCASGWCTYVVTGRPDPRTT